MKLAHARSVFRVALCLFSIVVHPYSPPTTFGQVNAVHSSHMEKQNLAVMLNNPVIQLTVFVCVCVCRQEFSSEACPDLTKEVYLQDIHCVGSLCKLYFRELPNPLLTFELYSKFTVSMSEVSAGGRSTKSGSTADLFWPHTADSN